MISMVIPVYNEAESLEPLYQEIDEVAAAHGYQVEIVFVNDGSTDDSWRVIEDLAARDRRVRGIRFRRNFGKAAALAAGFEDARGELVFTLDADLQDDPHEIPQFLAEMVSVGSKKNTLVDITLTLAVGNDTITLQSRTRLGGSK